MHKMMRVISFDNKMLLFMWMCLSLDLTQPPPSQVAVVTGADQDLLNLKVKVRSDVVQRAAKSSGRQTQVLKPPPWSAEDKEVGPTHCYVLTFSLLVQIVLFTTPFFNLIY